MWISKVDLIELEQKIKRLERMVELMGVQAELSRMSVEQRAYVWLNMNGNKADGKHVTLDPHITEAAYIIRQYVHGYVPSLQAS